jgi:hypothetical protein
MAEKLQVQVVDQQMQKLPKNQPFLKTMIYFVKTQRLTLFSILLMVILMPSRMTSIIGLLKIQLLKATPSQYLRDGQVFQVCILLLFL